MGVSWPSIGLINLNGQQHISMAYNDQIAILNPSNGVAARLINPDSGNPIRDNETTLVIGSYLALLMRMPTSMPNRFESIMRRS